MKAALALIFMITGANYIATGQISWVHISSKTVAFDIDYDGDQDIITGGEGKINQVWWWENPYPDFEKEGGWNRYLIRNTGGKKTRDQMVGNFDGKGNFPGDLVIFKGIDLHDSEIVDLDGDGDLDILGKPYDGDTPRIDVFLQNGTGER